MSKALCLAVLFCILGTVAGVSVCDLPLDQGPCNRIIAVWGFLNGTCVEWDYYGCEGNRNNFPTKLECERICFDLVDK